MEKEIIVANENFEDVVEELKAKIEHIESEKEAEKEKVYAEIEAKYATRLSKFNQILADPEIAHVEVIEVPDEVEESEENEEVEA